MYQGRAVKDGTLYEYTLMVECVEDVGARSPFQYSVMHEHLG
jgi:hypothetical protein